MHSTSLTFGLKKDGSPNAIFDGLDRLVCSFPQVHLTATGGNDIRKGSPYTQDVQLANARLFTTSPDMLAALEGAREALRQAMPHLPADKEAVFCGEWLDEINAAITKATAA